SPEPGRQPIELYVAGELVASSSNVNAVPDLSNINETWDVQVGNWRGLLQWNGLIDELLILPYAASDEQIRAWYELQAPFYDATPAIDADGQTIVAADNHVTIDRRGLTLNDGTQDRVAVGDISGRMWRGQPLPPGTYGLWTDRGYFSGELDAN